MAVIPEDCLNELKCTQCSNYLSIFPIMQSTDGKKIFCGRCQNASIDEILFHNCKFEILLQHIEFSCNYSKYGCNKKLFPAKMVKHEIQCNFKPFDCPLHNIADCKWHSNSNDILAHCQQTHKDFILKDNEFVVDCNDKNEIQNFVRHGTDLFILKWKIDETTNTISFSISEIQKCNKIWHFQITLSNKNLKKCIIDTSDTSQNTLELRTDCVNNILKNPAVIECRIKFSKDGENFDYIKYDNDNMLKEVECMICQENMISPIQKCKNGHNVCTDCMTTITKCSDCSLTVVASKPNVSFKNVVGNIIGPCKYYRLGCKFVSKFKNVEDHQQFCKFPTRKCPLSIYKKCEWTGLSCQLIDHVKDKHDDSFEANFDIHICEDLCQLGVFFDRIFLLRFGKIENDTYFDYGCSVQLVGPKYEIHDFRFVLSFKDQGGHGDILKMSRNCSPFLNQKYNFKNISECIYLSYDELEETGAIDNRFVSLKVYIIKDDY